MATVMEACTIYAPSQFFSLLPMSTREQICPISLFNNCRGGKEQEMLKIFLCVCIKDSLEQFKAIIFLCITGKILGTKQAATFCNSNNNNRAFEDTGNASYNFLIM